VSENQSASDSNYPPAENVAGSPVAPGSTARRSNGMAIAAMVLGIIGIVFAFFITYVGIILGVIAIVLALVARRRGEAVPGHGRGQILTGLILGILAVVISVVEIIVVLVILGSR
jgi:lysylphosphatidylglycerol synthetase-like protein (DUF2156 family)